MSHKKITKLSDLQFDERNANRHTMRGLAMVEESFARCGAGRSVLADKNGKLIAGNGATEVALGMGVNDDDIIVVENDGTKIVVVQRTDLELDGADPRARLLAIADNRTSEVSLCWNTEELKAFCEESREETHWLFRTDELAALNGADEDLNDLPDNHNSGGAGDGQGEQDSRGPRFELTLFFNSRRELMDAAQKLSAEGYQFRRPNTEAL